MKVKYVRNGFPPSSSEEAAAASRDRPSISCGRRARPTDTKAIHPSSRSHISLRSCSRLCQCPHTSSNERCALFRTEKRRGLVVIRIHISINMGSSNFSLAHWTETMTLRRRDPDCLARGLRRHYIHRALQSVSQPVSHR